MVVSGIPLGDMDSAQFSTRMESEGTIDSNFESVCVLPNVNLSIVAGKNVERFPQSSTLIIDQRPNSTGSAALGFDRVSADQILDLASQVLLVSSPSAVPCGGSNDEGSQTPKESIFDPFAPGHDELVRAPPDNRCMEESRNNVVRRLNFLSTTNLVRSRDRDSTFEEEQLFDVVYGSLLEVIISEWTKEFSSKSLAQVSDFDAFCTPKIAECLSGVAETCPRAPRKYSRKYRNIDRTLCQKLEF